MPLSESEDLAEQLQSIVSQFHSLCSRMRVLAVDLQELNNGEYPKYFWLEGIDQGGRPLNDRSV